MENFNFEKEVTANGIPIYVLSLPYLHTVAAGVTVKAGTIDELWPQEAGIAHALEHMVLRGTRRFSDAEVLNAYVEEIGGVKEASTNHTRMLFHGRVPQEHVERLVEFLSEVVNYPLLPEERITTEVQAIQNERRQKYDKPLTLLNRLILQHIYQDYPLGRDTLGTPESVLRFCRDDFLNFRGRFFCGANYALFIAGGITPSHVKELIERHFSEVPVGKPNKRELPLFQQSSEREYTDRGSEYQQAYVALAAPIGDACDKSTKALKLFCTMLGGGPSFPLFQELREKRGLCYQSFTGVVRFPNTSLFYVSLIADPKRYQKAIEVIFELIDGNKSNATLLEKAKRLRKGRLVMEFENLNYIIENAANTFIFEGKPVGYTEAVKDLDNLTIQDIELAVNLYLRPEQLSRVLLLAKGQE